MDSSNHNTSQNLGLIAMVSQNGVIGKDGDLPWHFPEDLKHFKKTTIDHAIIMGRKTFDSIGKPLPKRINIVLTKDSKLKIPGCFVTTDLNQAIDHARDTGDHLPMIIGGANIYELAMPHATHLFLTTLKENVEGDTFFPPWDKKAFDLVDERRGENPKLVFTQWIKKGF